MNKLLFLSGLYPEPYKDQILNNSKRGYQFAAQSFQEAIIKGLYENNLKFDIISKPFISTFPFGYKRFFVKSNTLNYLKSGNIKTSTILNLPLLNDIFNSTKSDVMAWVNQNKEYKISILVYSLNWSLIKVAYTIKKDFPNINLCVIVPDLPEFWGTNIVYKYLGINRYYLDKIYKEINLIDSFVFLTESMNLRLNKSLKNYVIIEGIYNPFTILNEYPKENFVLYSGSLHRKYGVLTLIQAFINTVDSKYSLVICGDGDAVVEVKRLSKVNERIVFLGKVSQIESIILQKKATLLVNPRTPENEFTSYSFPSKIIEYFASGTPVLMYKLPGIPIEYYDFCFTITNFSTCALTDKLNELLKLDTHYLSLIGEKAQKFIFNYKNPKAQTLKIISLLNG